MLKRNIILTFIAFTFFCCQKPLTTEEKRLIQNANESTPFQVLKTTNLNDSLFLRSQSKDIDLTKDKKDISMLVSRLKATLKQEEGVGIAAPQVGIARNLFLFMRTDKPGEPVEVVINPVIKNYSTDMVCFEKDGCLSIPGVWGNSKRYAWIEVEYYNEEGNRITEKLTGHSRSDDFVSVIFQHEYDHLQGILFIDKLCE